MGLENQGQPSNFRPNVHTSKSLSLILNFSTLFHLLVLRLPEAHEAHPGPQLPVLFLELGYSALEIGKLGLPPVARVLGRDAIAMCAGFLALLGCGLGAGALAGRFCR